MHCQNYIRFSSYMLREEQSQFANFPSSKALDEQCYSVVNNVLTDTGVDGVLQEHVLLQSQLFMVSRKKSPASGLRMHFPANPRGSREIFCPSKRTLNDQMWRYKVLTGRTGLR